MLFVVGAVFFVLSLEMFFFGANNFCARNVAD